MIISNKLRNLKKLEDGLEVMKFSTFLIIDRTTVTSGSEAVDGPTMTDLRVGKGPSQHQA